MAKRKLNWKNIKRVGAVGLAVVTIASTLTFSGSIVRDGSDRVKAAGKVPSIQDASSAVNYSTILGRATDFGIIADHFEQRMHMQTTYAVDKYSRTCGDFTTIDLIPQGSTAQFLLGGLDENNTYVPAFKIDGGEPGTYNIEAMPELLATRGTPEDLFLIQPGEGVQVLTTANSETSTNIQRMLGNVFETSEEIQNKVNNGYAVDYRDYDKKKYGGRYTLDFTGGDFTGKVVYVDVDNELLMRMRDSDGFRIVKDPSTIVVFNINDAAGSNASKYDEECVQISRYCVSEDGGATWADSANSTGKGSDEATRKNDEWLCQKVIFNITTTRIVGLDTTGGMFIIPNSKLAETWGPSCGWVVARNFANTYAEWHYIYNGGNQEFQSDGVGQMHFAARKAYTHFCDGKNTIEDQTISTEANQYSFYWYETNASYDVDGLTPAAEIKNTSETKLQFPTLEFFVDQAKAQEAGLPTHYIPSNTDKTFYYSIYEKDGAGAHINIELTVRNIKDKLQYYTRTTTYLDDGSIYKENKASDGSPIRISGIEFTLGAFFNVTDASVYLKKTVAGECEAAKTATYIYYIQDASGNYYDVNGENKGTVKAPINVQAGTTVVVNGLPNGKYTVSEDMDSAVQAGYTYDYPEPKEIVVDGKKTSSANLINTYYKSELKVKKTVDGNNDAGMGNATYYFRVKSLDFPGMYVQEDGTLSTNPFKFTVKQGPGGEKTIVPAVGGRYEVEEVTEDISVPTGYNLTVSYKNGQFDLSADKVASEGPEKKAKVDTEINNTFLKGTEFALILEKRVEGVDLDPNKEYEFYVSYYDEFNGKTFFINEKGEKQRDWWGNPVNDPKPIKVKANVAKVIRRTNSDDGANGLWGDEEAPYTGTTYTIRENITAGSQVSGLDGGVYYLKSVPASQTTTLKKENAQPKVVTTNTYESCNLVIDKQANIPELNGTTCEVTVKRSDGRFIDASGKAIYGQTIIPVTVGTPLTLKGSGIVAGMTYTVTEITPAVNNTVTVGGVKYKLTGVEGNGVEVSPTTDAPGVTATITNNYEKIYGNLKITKTAVGLPAGYEGQEFDITVMGPTENFNFKLGNGETKSFENIELGRYTIVENQSTAQIPGYTLTVTGDNKYAVTLVDSTVQEKEIINTYTEDTKPRGTLKISKAVDGDLSAASDEVKNKEYAFLVSGPEYGEIGLEVKITGANSVTLDNILTGTYTITERGTDEGGSAQIEGYTLDVTGNGVDKAVTIADTSTNPAEVVITNNYEEKSYLVIEKTIKGEINDLDFEHLTFVVKDNTGAEKATLKLGTKGDFTKSGNTYTSKKLELEPGTYTVEESTYTYDGKLVTVSYQITAADGTAGEKKTIGTDVAKEETETAMVSGAAEVEKGKTTTVAFENDYKTQKGNLVIKKTISGPITGLDLEHLTFTVKDGSGTVVDTLHLGKDADFPTKSGGNYTSRTLSLAPGTYTVEETTYTYDGKKVTVSYQITAADESKGEKKTGVTDATKGTGADTAVGEAVEVVSNKTTTVEFEDVYSDIPVSGEIVVVKVDGADQSKLAGAEFELYDAATDGSKIGETKTTGDNGQVVFDSLTVGSKYYLQETKAPDNYEAPSADRIEIEVSGTAENNVVTVTKTVENTKKSIPAGSLKIQKAVTKNTSESAGTEADGTYTFTIKKKGTDNVVGTVNVEISGGVTNTSDEVSLEPGTYVVTETVPTNGFLPLANDIEVEVQSGKTGDEAAIASFTNNKNVVTGGVQITKTVTIENGGAYPDGYTGVEFPISISVNISDTTKTLPDGVYGDVEFVNGAPKDAITIKAGTDITISGLPDYVTSVTVQESREAVKDLFTGYTCTNAGDIEITTTVDFTTMETIALENKYSKDALPTGTLSIRKDVTVNGNATTIGALTSVKVTVKKDGEDKWIDENGNEFSSPQEIIVSADGSLKTISNVPVGTYTVSEVLDGNGELPVPGYIYDKDNSKTTVGNISITSTSTDPSPVVMKNAYKKLAELKLNKVARVGFTGIGGARLALYKVGNDSVLHVFEWTSSETEVKSFQVEDGKYRIVEEKAPEGYKKSNLDVTFEVINGEIKNVGGEDGDYDAANDVVVFRNDPIGILSIHVKEEDTGKDVDGAVIEVTGPFDKPGVLGTKRFRTNSNGNITDDSGNEKLEVMPGDFTYKVIEVPVGYKVTKGATGTVTVPVNKEGHGEAQILPKAGLKITVLDEATGKPVPGAEVEVKKPDGTTETVTTDQNGEITKFEDDTPTGDYTITVKKVPEGYTVTVNKEQTAKVVKGNVTSVVSKINTKTGGLLITVLDEKTNEPVPNAEVEVVKPDGTKETLTTDKNGQVTKFTEKDSDGHYKAPIGDYKITVVKVPDGYNVTTGKTEIKTTEVGKVVEHIAKIGKKDNPPKDDDDDDKKPSQPGDTPSTNQQTSNGRDKIKVTGNKNTVTDSMTAAKTGESKIPYFVFGGSMTSLLIGAVIYVLITKKKREEEEYHTLSLK